jgi:hypothetical protein
VIFRPYKHYSLSNEDLVLYPMLPKCLAQNKVGHKKTNVSKVPLFQAKQLPFVYKATKSNKARILGC